MSPFKFIQIPVPDPRLDKLEMAVQSLSANVTQLLLKLNVDSVETTLTKVEVKKRKGELGEVFASQTEDVAFDHDQVFPVDQGMAVDGENVPVEGEGGHPRPTQ